MNTEKELPGTKNLIKIQCQVIRKIRPESFANLPKEFQRKSDNLSKKFTHKITVSVYDIETKDKLAFVIRKHYGFGIFNILFWSRFIKNRDFNDKFKCLIQRGRECPYKPRCRVYSIHQKGWSCKRNPRYYGAMVKRAKIEIMPRDFMAEKDYDYKWDRKSDKMHYFRKWYWKG